MNKIMKKLLLVLLVGLFMSCGNTKPCEDQKDVIVTDRLSYNVSSTSLGKDYAYKYITFEGGHLTVSDDVYDSISLGDTITVVSDKDCTWSLK